MEGKVLDLGGKSINASYYAHMQQDHCLITLTDITDQKDVLKLDVEQPFPLQPELYDVVLAFHLFEHVWDFKYCAHEIERVLRPGGRFIVSCPFLYPYHADPQDFWRFTDQAALKAWETENLKPVSIECIGEGVFTSMLLYPLGLLKRLPVLRSILTAMCYFVLALIDLLVFRLQRNKSRKIAEVYALEWIVVYEKFP